MNMFRSLFLGHGAPTLAVSDAPANRFLRELGQTLAPPTAVLVVSAHRAARGFDTGQAAGFHAWHDFGGFAPALYQLRYEPAGAPVLAARVAQAIAAAKLAGTPSDDARIDHGIWVPLSLMWPDARVPVVPIATPQQGTAAHLALGRALRPLTDEGVLVIGSGSLTHNLADAVRWEETAPVADWAMAFDSWVGEQLERGNTEALLDYRRCAPHAGHAHPTEEHLLPLFVALGAGERAVPLHRSFTYGSISMAAYGFQ